MDSMLGETASLILELGEKSAGLVMTDEVEARIHAIKEWGAGMYGRVRDRVAERATPGATEAELYQLAREETNHELAEVERRRGEFVTWTEEHALAEWLNAIERLQKLGLPITASPVSIAVH